MKNEHIQWTSIDDFIRKLEHMREEVGGDTPICVRGISDVYLDTRAYYYDGGWVAPSADGKEVRSSRGREIEGRLTGPAPGFGKWCVIIDSRPPATECKHGHVYPENAKRDRAGRRFCRECHRQRAVIYRAQKRNAS